MNIPTIAHAMNHLDAELIDAAITWQPKARNHAPLRWAALAACTALCLVCFGLALHMQDPAITPDPSTPPQVSQTDAPSQDQLVVNPLQSLVRADMDVQFSYYSLPLGNSTTNQESSDTSELLPSGAFQVPILQVAAAVPDSYTLHHFCSVDAPTQPGSREYIPHDYVLVYEAPEGQWLRIAMSAPGAPMRDVIIDSQSPAISRLNGAELIIHGFQGTYMVQFSCDQVHYDVETRNISLKALEALLSALLTVNTQEDAS